MMKCEDCAYFFRTDGDEHAKCQFTALRGEPSWLDVPPCEEEDDYEEDYEEPEELEDWQLAGFFSEEEYIEDQKIMMYVDAWKNGDFDY